jgi:hypothetical protein
MSGFAQLSNDLWSNAKMRLIAEEHPKEFALWVISISYCSDKQTDGVLSSYEIRRILGVKPAQERRMYELKLWEKQDENTVIHDYLAYQNSRENIEKNRKGNSDRQARFRQNHVQSNGDGNALRNAENNSVESGDVTPENKKEKYKNKKREIENPTPTLEDIENWQPKAGHRSKAMELADHGYPLVDVTDLGDEFRLSLQAKGIDHYGYQNLDAAFMQWLGKRAKSLRDERQSQVFHGITLPSKPMNPHRHTWKCSHVLELLQRDEATADPDDTALRAANLLNEGKTTDETLETLGLRSSESEWVSA